MEVHARTPPWVRAAFNQKGRHEDRSESGRAVARISGTGKRRRPSFPRDAAMESIDVDDPALVEPAGHGFAPVVGLDLERDRRAVDVDHTRPADYTESLGN